MELYTDRLAEKMRETYEANLGGVPSVHELCLVIAYATDLLAEADEVVHGAGAVQTRARQVQAASAQHTSGVAENATIPVLGEGHEDLEQLELNFDYSSRDDS